MLCVAIWYVSIRYEGEGRTAYVWLLCDYCHTTARRVVPTYTKCDVQPINLLLMMD